MVNSWLTSVPLARVLPLAGALPFLLGAALLTFNVPVLPVLGPVQVLVSAYGLAIVSFMAGVHWGQHMSGVSCPWNLLLTSNAATLIAWLSFVFMPPAWFAGVLAFLFLILLRIDQMLAGANAIDHNYFRTRVVVTGLVVLSLAVIANCLR